MKKKLPISFLFLFLLFSSCISIANAQISSSGFSISVPLEETDVQRGDIICSSENGNVKCTLEYSASLLGVITDNPSVSIEDPDLENSKLLAVSGIARVRVNGTGGNIADGDFVTSSETAGIGKKATSNGYVLGMAIESYEPQDPETTGEIQVLINIHPETNLTGVRGNLLQFIRRGISVPVFSPVESLRYLLAVLMVLISFTLGMIYFGRASRAGIEAVGRNPLAKQVIQFTVLLNIMLTIVIVLVGLGIAYLILIL
jgi:F0F1-type ATP synthase membrane subunit c/vacuolar-type H+-ATPase subunit K